MRIKFGGWIPNRYCNIGGFKFGSLVWDCHIQYASKKFQLILIW